MNDVSRVGRFDLNDTRNDEISMKKFNPVSGHSHECPVGNY